MSVTLWTGQAGVQASSRQTEVPGEPCCKLPTQTVLMETSWKVLAREIRARMAVYTNRTNANAMANACLSLTMSRDPQHVTLNDNGPEQANTMAEAGGRLCSGAECMLMAEQAEGSAPGPNVTITITVTITIAKLQLQPPRANS